MLAYFKFLYYICTKIIFYPTDNRKSFKSNLEYNFKVKKITKVIFIL